jgi:hypothetical protein
MFGSFVDFLCSALAASALPFLPCAFLHVIASLHFHRDNQPNLLLSNRYVPEV